MNAALRDLDIVLYRHCQREDARLVRLQYRSTDRMAAEIASLGAHDCKCFSERLQDGVLAWSQVQVGIAPHASGRLSKKKQSGRMAGAM